MTRQIIDLEDDDFKGISVNTFWGGKDVGECVQFTLGKDGYVQMTRKDALSFLKIALVKLETQIDNDKKSPPWWQAVALGDK